MIKRYSDLQTAHWHRIKTVMHAEKPDVLKIVQDWHLSLREEEKKLWGFEVDTSDAKPISVKVMLWYNPRKNGRATHITDSLTPREVATKLTDSEKETLGKLTTKLAQNYMEGHFIVKRGYGSEVNTGYQVVHVKFKSPLKFAKALFDNCN